MSKESKFLNQIRLLMVCTLPAVAAAQGFEGTWQGYEHTERLDAPFIFRITHPKPGAWAADVVMENDWGQVFHTDSMSVDGRLIRFSIPVFGSYEGQLSEHGNSIEGKWTSGTASPLRMERAPPAPLWRETPHKTRFITVERNVRVEVLDWGGTGRPVVMLAGLEFTAHVFSQFAAKLIPYYHVYGITRRGYGASSVPSPPAPAYTEVAPNTYDLTPPADNPYDVNRLGDDIVAVLGALRIGRAVLVGHSIAGEELTSVASRYPDRVAGLIYLDGLVEYAFSDGQRYDALFTPQHPMRVKLPPGQSPQLTPDRAVQLGMHEFRQFPAMPALAIFALPHTTPASIATNPAALAAYKANQQRAIDRMERIKPLLPTVRIVNLPNADHDVWESNEAEVLSEMKTFIAGLPNSVSPAAAGR